MKRRKNPHQIVRNLKKQSKRTIKLKRKKINSWKNNDVLKKIFEFEQCV